jgi:hypothetical protein
MSAMPLSMPARLAWRAALLGFEARNALVWSWMPRGEGAVAGADALAHPLDCGDEADHLADDGDLAQDAADLAARARRTDRTRRAADARAADLGPDDRDAAGGDRLEAAEPELEQTADARGDEAARELVHGQRGDGDLLHVGRQGEEGVDEGLRRLRRDLHAARDRVERDVVELGEEAAATGATRLVEGVGDEVDALLHEGQDPLDELLEDRDALRGDDRDEPQQRRREPLARLLAHVRHPLAHDVELARQGLAHRRRGAADLFRQGVLGRAEGVGLELRLVDDDAVLAERPGVAVEGLADRLGGRLEADPLRLRQVEDERRELGHLSAGRAEAEQHRVGALDRVVVDAGQVEQRARLLVDRRRLGL